MSGETHHVVDRPSGFSDAAPLALVDLARVQDLIERLVEIATGDGDRLVLDVEAGVEGLVELSTDIVFGVLIEGGWVGNQFEALIQPLGPEPQLGAGVSQAGFDPASLQAYGVAAFQNLGPVKHAVGRQVDESMLALGQPGQLVAQLGMYLLSEFELVGDGLLDLFTYGSGEVRWYLQPWVVEADGVLHLPSRQMRQVASTVLA